MTAENDSAREEFEQTMVPIFEQEFGMNPDSSTWHRTKSGYTNRLIDQHFATWQASRERYVPSPCEWLQDEWDGSWDTSCGNKYEIIDGTPDDNHMKFCTFCGGHLVATPNGGNGE